MLTDKHILFLILNETKYIAFCPCPCTIHIWLDYFRLPFHTFVLLLLFK
jgi:hypothetical protein